MAWTNPSTPNLTDYIAFLRLSGFENTKTLPDSSPSIPATLGVAQQIVSEALAVGSCVPSTSTSLSIYCLAVYNLATDRLVNYGPDVQGQTMFKDLRKQFGILAISVGVSSQVSDNGTAVGILNPEQMQLFTLQDLQTLKTPWGRQYMAFAQMSGRTLFGLT